MEYYYALLENYNQLKRRKFKLSLREETVSSAEDIIKAMQGAAEGEAGEQEFPHPKNPENVAKASINTQGNLNVKFGQNSGFGVPVGHEMGASGKMGIKELDAWLAGDGGGDKAKGAGGGDKAKGAGGGDPAAEGGVDPNEKELEALAQEASLKLEKLSELDENFSPDKMENLRALLYAPVPNVLGAAERKIAAVRALNNFLSLSTEIAVNPDLAGEGKFVEKINAFITDNDIQLTPHGVSFQGSYFETDFMVEGEFPIATAIAAMDALQKKDKEEKGIGSSAIRIPKPSKKEQGRRDQYRGGAAEFMAEGTAPLAALLDPATPPEKRKELTKKLRETIEKAQHDTQSLDQNRKPMFELDAKGEKKRLLDPETKVPLKNAKGEPIYIPIMEKALDIPTLVSVFTVGVGAREGQLLVGDEGGIDDAEAIGWLRERLINSGVDEEHLDLVLKEIAESDDKEKSGLQAVILILAANREFEIDYMGDLKPASTRAVGGGAEIDGQQEEMTDQGAKADMIDTFCDNPDTGEPYTKDEIVAHFDSLLSPEQKAHYATGCGAGEGEDATPFAGAEALVRESTTDDGSPCLDVDRELKVFNKKAGATHKLGQQSSTTVDSVCDKTGSTKMTDTTESFMNKTKDRLENCGFPTVFDTMCDFDTALDAKTAGYDTIFNMKPKSGQPAFSRTKCEAALTLWEKASGMTKAKKKKRYDAAYAAINQGPYPKWITEAVAHPDNLKKDDNGKMVPKKDAQKLCEEELSKIPRDLKAQAMYEMLREKDNIVEKPPAEEMEGSDWERLEVEDVDGTILSGEGLEYMIGRYAVTCGSDRECVKQKRHLSDNSQSISFNNAEVQANLAALENGTGRIRQGSGVGTQFYLEVKNPDTGEWEVRAQGGGEKGGITWHSSKKGSVSHRIDKKKPAKKKPAKKKPAKKKTTNNELLTQFLQGQQALLEKLIDQTT
jgi:hypothetical protein